MCLHWTKRVIREFFAILLFVSIEAVPFVVQWHIQIFDTGSCYARKKYICHNKQWSVLVNWVSRCEFSLHCCHTTQLFGNFAVDWLPIYVSNCTSFTWFIFRATFCLIIHIKCCPAGQYNYNRAFQHTHTLTIRYHTNRWGRGIIILFARCSRCRHSSVSKYWPHNGIYQSTNGKKCNNLISFFFLSYHHFIKSFYNNLLRASFQITSELVVCLSVSAQYSNIPLRIFVVFIFANDVNRYQIYLFKCGAIACVRSCKANYDSTVYGAPNVLFAFVIKLDSLHFRIIFIICFIDSNRHRDWEKQESIEMHLTALILKYYNPMGGASARWLFKTTELCFQLKLKC